MHKKICEEFKTNSVFSSYQGLLLCKGLRDVACNVSTGATGIMLTNIYDKLKGWEPVKEKYKPLSLSRQFGGINTIEFTQALGAKLEKTIE